MLAEISLGWRCCASLRTMSLKPFRISVTLQRDGSASYVIYKESLTRTLTGWLFQIPPFIISTQEKRAAGKCMEGLTWVCVDCTDSFRVTNARNCVILSLQDSNTSVNVHREKMAKRSGRPWRLHQSVAELSRCIRSKEEQSEPKVMLQIIPDSHHYYHPKHRLRFQQ